MKINLPIIGTVQFGEEPAKAVPTAHVGSVEIPVTSKNYDVLGGLLSFSNGGSLSTQTTISQKILKANKDWVYRNNDVIAQEVSAIEFELFSIDLAGGEIEFNQIEDHPILDLLDKFNSRTTKSDGLYMTESHKKLTGDAFWLLDKNGDAVDNIFILPPDKIELVLADPTEAGADLIQSYKYTDTIDRKMISEVYTPDQIIHFKKPNPDNPFRGYGAVEALADAIDTDNITNETQRNFFEKGAIGNFVLTTEANVTQDQLKRLKSEIQAAYGGAKNAFKAMIFGNGLKPMDIGFSNKDMDFLNLLEWYRDKIMIGFGNTKASIGIIDDVNRASYEGSLNGWLRGTVKPDMTSIVQTINEFLVPLYGDNLILGFKDPITRDVTADAQQAVQLKNAGIIQVNEAREMVSLSPIEGGDVFQPQTAPQADPSSPDKEDPTQGDDTEQTPKQIYAKRKVKSNLPDSLKHFDIEPVLRSRSIYFKRKINRQLKETIAPIIRKKIQNSKKIPKPVVKINGQFTEDQIEGYYEKQIHLVEAFEKQFYDGVLKLLTSVKDQTMDNFEHEIRTTRGLKRFMEKFNPNHDNDGKFGEGDGSSDDGGDGGDSGGGSSGKPEGIDEAVDNAVAINKKIDKATSGSKMGAAVGEMRDSTATYLEANGASVDKFKKLDENWVGNSYGGFEKHIKNGDSEEMNLMHDLQMAYFKKKGITEITLYRGIYNKQAKGIKDAIASGKKVTVAGDYAASFTGYKATAKEYAGGAAFTAPDKIKDSVVIKQTFKVKDILYSTRVSTFYAGNGDDEYIVSTPKGYKLDSSNVEVIK